MGAGGWTANLPQSAAFELLRTRLNTVSSLGVLQLMPKAKTSKSKSTAGIDFDALLAHFNALQAKHEEAREARMVAEQKSV